MAPVWEWCTLESARALPCGSGALSMHLAVSTKQEHALHVSESTTFQKQLTMRAYVSSNSMQDLHTKSSAFALGVKNLVDILIKQASITNEKNTKQEPFVAIEGKDADGKPWNRLRLWQMTKQDIGVKNGDSMIVRGLRMQEIGRWNSELRKRVPSGQGLELACVTGLTAVEKVEAQ